MGKESQDTYMPVKPSHLASDSQATNIPMDLILDIPYSLYLVQCALKMLGKIPFQ